MLRKMESNRRVDKKPARDEGPSADQGHGGGPKNRIPSGGDDERLLIEAAKADPQRFATLYERNFDRVYAFVARRYGSRGEAEDLTAEVFHAGATSMEPPALQPYGERRAAVRDAFGNQWYLAAPSR